jgi:hypothetical protein
LNRIAVSGDKSQPQTMRFLAENRRAMEHNAVVAALSQLRAVCTSALSRSNQIDATLFD